MATANAPTTRRAMRTKLAAAAAAAGYNTPAPLATRGPRPPSAAPSRRLLVFPAIFCALLPLLLLLLPEAVSSEGDTPLLSKHGRVKPPAAKPDAAARGPDDEEAKRTQEEGLYFYLTAKIPRQCLVLEGGKGSIFHVHYGFPAAKDGEQIKLELRQLFENSTPKNRFSHKPTESKIISKEQGSHQFKIKSNKDTTYSLCAVTASHPWGRGLKLYLDLDSGKQDRAYDRDKKVFNLNDMQISMIQLKNTAQQMVRKADYSKELETAYHRLLLQLNREVLWWPVSQVIILVAMGFYQVRYLKKFFKSKRLV